METFKLRLKLGVNEFEAEGSQDYVEKQRDVFLKNIETDHSRTGAAEGGKPGAAHTPRPPGSGKKPTTPQNPPANDGTMNKIVHQQGELLTLSVLPEGDNREGDALLVLLLAHKVLKGLDVVSAGDLLAGMKQSGLSSVDRLDRVMTNVDASFVGSTGNRKGKKYRLFNPGLTKAKQLAEALTSKVG